MSQVEIQLGFFMHSKKWSLKAFLKLILTSATYRQSSSLDPEKFEVDPGHTTIFSQNLKGRLERILNYFENNF